MQPQRLKGLILADPTFLTPQRQREVQESDVVSQHRQILNQSKEDYLSKQLQLQHGRRSRELIELFAHARFQTSIHAFEILTSPSLDYMQLISNLDIPILLIIGDTNPVVSVDMATEFSKLNQKLKLVQIAEAGHAVPYDQPERFLDVVQTFLQSVSI